MELKKKLGLDGRRGEILAAYVQIVLGCMVGGAAYPLFLVPNNIAPGGLTGVGTIFNYVAGWPVGLSSMLMNIPLFLIGFKAMGRVLGIGLGLILRGGATTGGTDMVARIVHRKMPFLSVGMFLFLIDCCVVIAAGIVMGSTEGLYALICIYVSGKVIDVVMAGLSSNKACFIITPEWEKVSDRIMQDMERGVTQLMARGGYSKTERPVVMCVMSRQEISRVKEIVHEADEHAFMFITDAHEALGEGFSKLSAED